jgi:hypothetical protein
VLIVLFNAGIAHSVSKYSLSHEEKAAWYNKSVIGHPESYLYTSEDVEQLSRAVVPEEYIEAFLYYSETGSGYLTDILRIYLLGLGDVESEWMRTKSYKQNANGTYDLGYLMLNEGNLYNRAFMDKYGPVNEFEAKDKIELYLIACIRLFKDLYLRYGCDAFYAYNAGERCIPAGIPDSTYVYKYVVKQRINKVLDRLYGIAEDNRAARQRHFYEKQKRFILGELEKALARHSSDILEGSSIYRSKARQSRYTGDYCLFSSINYDPRKRFAGTPNPRRFVIRSKNTGEAVEEALRKA